MIRPFIDFLREQRAGETEVELSKALNDLVREVERTGRKGTLTYTIQVAPVSKEMSGQLLVTDDVKITPPKPKRGATLFFSTPENNLSRRDPRQSDLDLKPVPTAVPDHKSIEAEGATNVA